MTLVWFGFKKPWFWFAGFLVSNQTKNIISARCGRNFLIQDLELIPRQISLLYGAIELQLIVAFIFFRPLVAASKMACTSHFVWCHQTGVVCNKKSLNYEFFYSSFTGHSSTVCTVIGATELQIIDFNLFWSLVAANGFNSSGRVPSPWPQSSERVANDYVGPEVLMCRLRTAKMEGEEEGSTT
jgi:hypothetical protein